MNRAWIFHRVRLSLLLVAFAAGGGLRREAMALRWPLPPLNPKTYSSPSGQFALRVDPSDPQGRGKGQYRMVKDGQEVWNGELPYTLRDVRVLDDGTAAGYGYTLGKELRILDPGTQTLHRFALPEAEQAP